MTDKIRLTDPRTGKFYTAALHRTMPAYAPHGIGRMGSIDGEPVKFVLRPGYPDSPRVNFEAEKGRWFYFDDEAIHNEMYDSDRGLAFLTAEASASGPIAPKTELTQLRVTTIGNSAGVILPREILNRLRIDKGDKLIVIDTPDGIELTPYDPEFAEQMEIAERIMREDRDVLRRLAK